MGRPKSDDPRIHPYGFRATDSEAAELDKLAAAHGLTPGEFVRMKALGARMPKPPVPEVNREKWAELARTTANLNQIAAHLNQGGGVDAAGLAATVTDLAEQVRRLRLELLGVKDEQPKKAEPPA